CIFVYIRPPPPSPALFPDPAPLRSLHDRVAGGGEDLEVLARGADLRDGVEYAPLAEAVHGGGAQADSGTDLPDAGGLFVDADVGAEQAQRFGRRRAAVAGADDGDLQVLEVRALHGRSLYFWRVRK